MGKLHIVNCFKISTDYDENENAELEMQEEQIPVVIDLSGTSNRHDYNRDLPSLHSVSFYCTLI